MWYEKPLRKEVIFYALIPMLSLIILSSETKGGEDSLSKYWERPIQLQIPNSKSQIPNFFYPEACGGCHKEQYDDWKGSLHSKAVSHGLLGQLVGTDLKSVPKDPEFAMSCYFCHAPMMEQAEMTQGARGKGQGARR